MSLAFPRSIRALNHDAGYATLVGLLVGIVLLALWGAWLVLGRIPIYETSRQWQVARDGTLPRPHLLQEVRTPNGQRVQGPQTGVLSTVVQPETARQVRQIMEVAVNDGYASGAKIPGVRVGGKTGTAETGRGTPPHAWFLGIAPIDQPRYIVVVMIENGGEGSQVAAPLAGRLLAAALK